MVTVAVRSNHYSKSHNSNKYRSGLEARVAKELTALDISFEYEKHKIKFTQPQAHRTYTPDYLLPNGIWIETKGKFESDDRKKHLWVQEQHPELDIRFVFTNPNAKINKGSPTSYAMWCEKNNFKYAAKSIPKEWLNEPLNRRSLSYGKDSKD